MKKLNRLFAILIAVLGVGSLSAQTDVTSQYLTNAGFDDETSFVTNGICTYAKDCSANGTTLSGMQPVNGWTFGVNNGDALASGAYAWGAPHFLGGGGYTIPTTDESGNSTGGALGVCAVWNASLYYYQDVTLPSGVYEFTYSVYNSGTGANSIDANLFGFVANNGSSFYGATKTFKANSWTTETVSFVLTAETKGKISVGIDAANAGSGSSHHLFVDCVKLIRKSFTDVTEANPVDLTSRVSNTKAAWTGATETPGYDGVTMVAVYKGSDWTGDALSQTINGLPAGNYRMEAYCQAHSSWDTDVAAEGATGYTYLCANEYKLDVPIRNADGATTKQLHTFEKISITNGSLKISVVNEKNAANWISVYVKSLTFLGPDKSLEETTFNNNVTALKALSKENLPAAFVTKINNLIISYGSADASSMTLSELVAANGEIKAVTEAHSGVTVAFGNLTAFIELCTEYIQNSNTKLAEVLSAFQTAISDATTAGDNATSADAINIAYNDLESARQTYAKNAVPVYPYAFDMTFLLTNPNFDSNTNGWTATGGAGRMSAGNMECYNGNFTFALADKLTGLGNGTWEVSVDGFYRYGGYNDAEAAHNGGTEDLKVKFYANTNEVDLKSIMEGADKAGGVGATTTGGVRVPNSPADGNSYFPTGCYSNTVSTLVTDGTLTFGLKKESTQGNDWTLFDNFRLVYKGVDVSELQSSLSALITTANGIKDTKMGSTEKNNLDKAINDANASETDADELNEMLSTLQSAYDAAVASIDTYSKVPAYIAKAKTIGVTLADTYQEQYDNSTIEGNAETVFQALEVATYNYVKENFPYDVELLKADGWNSKGENTAAADFSNEHWSGEVRSYKNQDDSNGQGWNANAWSIDFDQSVTLPAGEYVFKVAGRKSAGTTLELFVTMGETVLGTVNDFPAGNNARGINKAGVTSFDPEDEAGFARDGNGFGWQWRYVKFTLNAKSTVKVAVHAEANEIHQWVSFGDYTLQMTEETYLEANKGGLDAPTAAAQALVNAVPMGTEEIVALNTALNLPVTTGAELQAKIVALETAVANANAWVTDYNEAKAPLVAALDRFEADYNNAENGALYHMNKDRWDTAIEKAQAAAVAKDVTNSYDGFEEAANKLVEALDAATTSVNEYAALKSAIDNAEELGGGDDWGDEPFQKSESTKESFNTTKTQAQTAYDVAEVDGEEVAAVIESLNNAINGVVLNAPEEGQRYYIKVATEGHGKNGNAWLMTLGATGDNNPTGYGINANNVVKGHLNQAFIFTQVEGNLYNISIERAEGTVYLTYGALNGSAAGWKNQQIQATTDAEKKGEFKIVPTGKNGILKILNTIDNNYLDCQDGGSIYTDTDIKNEEFAFEPATETEVTLSLSKVGWATLILPFDAELPEGVKAYSCTEADGETLTLTEAESLKANTPYLMNGEESEHDFTGYGLADKDSYTKGLFTGTFVDYQTTADGKTYVLQNQNGNLAFYLVTNEAQPWIRAYRSYMVYEGAAGAPKFSLGRGEGTTSIDKAQLTIDNVVIYDLMGRKVSTMEKGGVYIVNGKKVVIK